MTIPRDMIREWAEGHGWKPTGNYLHAAVTYRKGDRAIYVSFSYDGDLLNADSENPDIWPLDYAGVLKELAR